MTRQPSRKYHWPTQAPNHLPPVAKPKLCLLPDPLSGGFLIGRAGIFTPLRSANATSLSVVFCFLLCSAAGLRKVRRLLRSARETPLISVISQGSASRKGNPSLWLLFFHCFKATKTRALANHLPSSRRVGHTLQSPLSQAT